MLSAIASRTARFRIQITLSITLVIALCSTLLTSCDLPQVSAEERLFLPLSVDFLGEFDWPTNFEAEATPVGGLSGIVYDRPRDRFYALSDDRSALSPARFYTLKLNLDRADASAPAIDTIDIESITTLKAEDGSPYPPDSLDPEGIALSPRNTIFIASEGVAATGATPFIDEFDLETGQWQRRLPIPARFLPEKIETEDGVFTKGVQSNLGFEALTINPVGRAAPMVEPFRLFAATESALSQDLNTDSTDLSIRNRFLHYLIGEDQTTLISEHLYLLSPDTIGTVYSGLSEILVLDQGGHFLGLERSFGLQGFNAKLYQLASGSATDVSAIPAIKGDLGDIRPIQKQLLFDLGDLDIQLDNLEGMTLGPRLPDGSQSLVLVSDNNFSPDQIAQFLLFRLRA